QSLQRRDVEAGPDPTLGPLLLKFLALLLNIVQFVLTAPRSVFLYRQAGHGALNHRPHQGTDHLIHRQASDVHAPTLVSPPFLTGVRVGVCPLALLPDRGPMHPGSTPTAPGDP